MNKIIKKFPNVVSLHGTRARFDITKTLNRKWKTWHCVTMVGDDKTTIEPKLATDSKCITRKEKTRVHWRNSHEIKRWIHWNRGLMDGELDVGRMDFQQYRTNAAFNNDIYGKRQGFVGWYVTTLLDWQRSACTSIENWPSRVQTTRKVRSAVLWTTEDDVGWTCALWTNTHMHLWKMYMQSDNCTWDEERIKEGSPISHGARWRRVWDGMLEHLKYGSIAELEYSLCYDRARRMPHEATECFQVIGYPD